jgi:hypothetical protein
MGIQEGGLTVTTRIAIPQQSVPVYLPLVLNNY